MLFLNKFKKLENFKKVVEEKVSALNFKKQKGANPEDESKVSPSLEKNISIITKLFQDDDSFVTRRIVNEHKSYNFFICYCDGVVNTQIINDFIIRPLMRNELPMHKKLTADEIINNIVMVSEINKLSEFGKIIETVTYGDTILFVDGIDEAIVINSRFFTTRTVAEPDAEKILSGPREGFTEGLMTNLSLIRRKLRTNDFKIRAYTLGERTKTQMFICYIDGIANKTVIDELYKRLDKLKIDGVLDSNYIAELIRDNSYSPYSTMGYTERPDVVVAKLLEGRVALVVDGTPVVLTIPFLFIENFQSNEDYYLNFFYSSFTRMLRMISYFLTITVPALYIGIFAFHLETMPPQLMVSIASERISVPLPAALEAYLMLLIFDILREAGMRMPSNAGQALSIVGALVIGQAAVEAKLIAAPMIIIVGIVGITNLLVPKMNSAVMIVRFGLLTLSSFFGLTGIVLGVAAMVVHMCNLKSFGVPILSSLSSLKYQDVKDSVVRSPWPEMINRPTELTSNLTRMDNDEQSN